jgi:hypothetical protein
MAINLPSGEIANDFEAPVPKRVFRVTRALGLLHNWSAFKSGDTGGIIVGEGVDVSVIVGVSSIKTGRSVGDTDGFEPQADTKRQIRLTNIKEVFAFFIFLPLPANI